MAHILTSKRYVVNTEQSQVKIFVARHSNDICYAGVLHYTKTGSWSKGEQVILHYELEYFIGKSENEVFKEAEDWIKKNLESNPTIIEQDNPFSCE